MSTLIEIEEAIEELPQTDVETLAAWLERKRLAGRNAAKAGKREGVSAFLQRWSGAVSDLETDDEAEAHRTARLMEKHVK